MATTQKYTVTIEPQIKKDFDDIAKKKGIKFSTWIASKMKEYIEENKDI